MLKHSNNLNETERGQLEKIRNVFYMSPPLKLLEDFIKDSKLPEKQAFIMAFDHINSFMQNSKEAVGKIQMKRQQAGEVRDLAQAGKAIVGAMFQNLVHYLFLMNKSFGNIPQHINITPSETEAHRVFGKNFVINIGEETQKPDCDLVVYNQNNLKAMILSLKTSMRERAGQTLKWKLLLDIAFSNDDDLRQRHQIEYRGKQTPLMCFITSNFYDEINNPQQRGMFKLFDASFIAKPDVKHDLVRSLSQLPHFIKETIA